MFSLRIGQEKVLNKYFKINSSEKVILEEKSKPKSTDDYDKIVCAELPDKKSSILKIISKMINYIESSEKSRLESPEFTGSTSSRALNLKPPEALSLNIVPRLVSALLTLI